MATHGEILLSELDKRMITARLLEHQRAALARERRDEQILHVLRGILGRLDAIEAASLEEVTQ